MLAQQKQQASMWMHLALTGSIMAKPVLSAGLAVQMCHHAGNGCMQAAACVAAAAHRVVLLAVSLY